MSARKKGGAVLATFVGDDDVGQHIKSTGERKSNLRQNVSYPTQSPARPQRSAKRVSIYEPSVVEDEVLATPLFEDDGKCLMEAEDVFKPPDCVLQDRNLTGNDMFGFQSPRRHSSMHEKALRTVESLTPKKPPKSILKKTPSKASIHTPKKSTESPFVTTRDSPAPTTPSRGVAGSVSTPKRGLATPSVATPRRRAKRSANLTATPHRLRARNQAESSESSDSAASLESDSDDEIENVCPISTPTSRGSAAVEKTEPGTPKSAPKRGKARKIKEVSELGTMESANDYFDRNERTMTSDRTLDQLDRPKLDHETMTEALKTCSVGFEDERKKLYEKNRKHFRKWVFDMCNGFNVLLFGLGSKLSLITDFCSEMISDFNQLIIHGFFPSLTIKSILNNITETYLDHTGTFKSLDEQVDFIRDYFETEYQDFFLVIHNIDGAMLRPAKVQTVLSSLASIRGFHIIASIDHINAPLIWDQAKTSAFNWLTYDVTTFEHYTEETSYENSLLIQRTGALGLSSLTHVMRSLTHNAKEIFYLVAEYQLQHVGDAQYNGYAFSDLYKACREAFLVNSEMTLTTQLTEFRDHKLIKSKKTNDGVERLVIPLDSGTLQEYMDSAREDM